MPKKELVDRIVRCALQGEIGEKIVDILAGTTLTAVEVVGLLEVIKMTFYEAKVKATEELLEEERGKTDD
jgi:hypothetical protein